MAHCDAVWRGVHLITQSGFAITLLAGSWIEPFNLDIKTPEGMGFKGHALYLRSGLVVAKELMTKRLS
jgi:hypothetical protein